MSAPFVSLRDSLIAAGARTRNLVVGVVALALCLIVIDAQAGVGQGLRGAAATVFGPLERVAGAPARALRGDQAAELAAVRAENQALREQLGKRSAAELSQRRLATLAALAPPAGYLRIPAEVIAVSTPADLTRAVTLSAGTQQGVAVGSAVLSPAGVIGVVNSAGLTTSTVLLLSDSTSHALVRVVSSKELGFLTGTGAESTGSLALVDQLAELKAGQKLVTAGSREGGPFPAGLPVGRISEVTGSAADLTRAATVTLAANESALESVLVLTPEAS